MERADFPKSRDVRTPCLLGVLVALDCAVNCHTFRDFHRPVVIQAAVRGNRTESAARPGKTFLTLRQNQHQPLQLSNRVGWIAFGSHANRRRRRHTLDARATL